jgi:heptaprenyl diphosphate synthase
VIEEKTASLIATSARFGGLFSGATPELVEALEGYGETIGIAFQLSDDLLDIASESVQSGKTPGTDLREGVPTLPVLYALAGDDTDASAVRLREILATGPVTDDRLHAEALGLLRESAAMKRARETVRSYAEEARARLAPLPDGSARRAMEALCDFIADRTN